MRWGYSLQTTKRLFLSTTSGALMSRPTSRLRIDTRDHPRLTVTAYCGRQRRTAGDRRQLDHKQPSEEPGDDSAQEANR